MGALRAVGDGLAQGFYMLWDTLWALVLGFTVSGAVQAFVTRGQMERALGRRSAATLVRATFLGAVSSSCSYAATSMAKSLFAKGADFTAAIAFMVASTNLVIELGIVLALLIGWQFTASELVGGLLMIALLGLGSRLFLPRALVEAARRRLRDEAGEDGAGDPVSGEPPTEAAASPDGIRTLSGWSNAAAYAIADVTMLRRELVIGFTVAGFLAALVPATVWTHLFVTGHGFASSLENVVVGPLIAILSFVCSIGNVPLAAALWKGGISFGGVVAFIFADLVTLPLLLVYRRYYGTRLALRLLALLWLVMSASGLAVEYAFRAIHAIPLSRPLNIAPQGVALDATTLLDVLALVAVAGLITLQRARGRLGAGGRLAQDPVCGMQVDTSHAPARRSVDQGTVYFCSDSCAQRHDARRAGASHARGTG